MKKVPGIVDSHVFQVPDAPALTVSVDRGIAQQFGLATIPSFSAARAPFTSGTTSGTVGSMRKALDLSTTTAPAFTAWGAIVSIPLWIALLFTNQITVLVAVNVSTAVS